MLQPGSRHSPAPALTWPQPRSLPRLPGLAWAGQGRAVCPSVRLSVPPCAAAVLGQPRLPVLTHACHPHPPAPPPAAFTADKKGKSRGAGGEGGSAEGLHPWRPPDLRGQDGAGLGGSQKVPGPGPASLDSHPEAAGSTRSISGAFPARSHARKNHGCASDMTSGKKHCPAASHGGG